VKPEGDSEQKGGRREETKEHQKQDGFENHNEAVRVCVCVCVCVLVELCASYCHFSAKRAEKQMVEPLCTQLQFL
jgi:hypothetical protein